MLQSPRTARWGSPQTGSTGTIDPMTALHGDTNETLCVAKQWSVIENGGAVMLKRHHAYQQVKLSGAWCATEC